MNSYSCVFILLNIVTYSNYVENCKSTTQYFPGGPDGVGQALVILKGRYMDSEITGIISFTQLGYDGPLSINGNITGLTMMTSVQKHGLHVHHQTLTNAATDNSRCSSAGGHFNPTKQNHGNISDKIRHVGDYGNFNCIDGVIHVNIIDTLSKLYGPNGIIGRAMILHQLEDDLGRGGNPESLKTGNAGARIACGIIGIVKTD